MVEEREFLWKCKGGLVKLIGEDICYLHTEQGKTFIHTVERVYEILSSLRKEEERLKELLPVVRIHHGYLVHLGRLESLVKNDAIMRNGDILPVSENRKKYVLEQIVLYVNREGRYKKTSKYDEKTGTYPRYIVK